MVDFLWIRYDPQTNFSRYLDLIWHWRSNGKFSSNTHKIELFHFIFLAEVKLKINIFDSIYDWFGFYLFTKLKWDLTLKENTKFNSFQISAQHTFCSFLHFADKQIRQHKQLKQTCGTWCCDQKAKTIKYTTFCRHIWTFLRLFFLFRFEEKAEKNNKNDEQRCQRGKVFRLLVRVWVFVFMSNICLSMFTFPLSDLAFDAYLMRI